MADKNIRSRMQQKHDISSNWALATNFVPLAGEIIVYSDLNKFKIGDGVTLVGELPFATSDISDFIGATSSTAGEHGLVPAPQAGDEGKYLKGDGTWDSVDALPSQSGQNGKFLTTDGSEASWAEVNIPEVDQTYDSESTNAQSGKAVAEAVDGLIPIYYSEDDIAPERDSIWCQYEKAPDYLCFTAEEPNAPLEMVGSPRAPEMDMWYSYDKINWNRFEISQLNEDREIVVPGTVITLTNIGDKVYFKGNNDHGFSRVNKEIGVSYSNEFIIREKRISVSGNIMTLMDETGKNNTLYDDNFGSLFARCNKLSDASELELPATTLAYYCYREMFIGCGSLTTAPELPATILAYGCYFDMFGGCASLTTAPELPATTLAEGCYAEMFASCESLTIPPELPATTLTEYCYYDMFSECTSLTTVPELPATTFANNCYDSMFLGCTSLYVSETSGTGYNKAWKIPTNGNASGNYTMYGMFTDCLGTRSTNDPLFDGIQKTYYTQNTPV